MTIGNIRSTFWRRVALIGLAIPFTLWNITPSLLRNLPYALGEAWEAFTDAYDGPGERLLVLGFRKAWSSNWTTDQ